MADVLDGGEVDRRLPEAWSRDGDAITRTYGFDEYLDGVAFAAECGEIAEEEFHHPEITIRYGEVEIELTSHEAGGITERDLEMAELFDEVA